MTRLLWILVATTSVAVAQPRPPSGYQCGAGKAVAGKGCRCPQNMIEQRNAKNYAICAKTATAGGGAAGGGAAAGGGTADTSGGDGRAGGVAVDAPVASSALCKQAGVAVAKSRGFDPFQISPDALRSLIARTEAAVAGECVSDKWTREEATCFTQKGFKVCSLLLSSAKAKSLQASVDVLMADYAKKLAEAQAAASSSSESQVVEPTTKSAGENKRVVVTGSEIKLTAQVQFRTATAVITAVSFPQLNDVANVLKDRPTIRIRVEGHTDSQGADAANMQMSADRANAVKAYLVRAGIAADRIEAKGYGETMPIASNTTPAGRAENRRIEFVVLSQ